MSKRNMREELSDSNPKPDVGIRSLPLREQKDVSDFLQVLKNNGLDKEKQQLEGLINYIKNMENLFDGVMEELGAIHEQINQLQNKGSKSTMGMVAEQAQEKVDTAKKSLSVFKEGLIEAAKNGVKNFKEKGKSALKSTIEAMQIPKALEFLKTKIAFVYSICLEQTGQHFKSSFIFQELFDKWQISIKELHQAAVRNTPKLCPYRDRNQHRSRYNSL